VQNEFRLMNDLIEIQPRVELDALQYRKGILLQSILSWAYVAYVEVK